MTPAEAVAHWGTRLAERQALLARAATATELRVRARRVQVAAEHLAAALDRRAAIAASEWACRVCGKVCGPQFEPHFWYWGVCASCFWRDPAWATETAPAWRRAHDDARIARMLAEREGQGERCDA